MALSSRGEAVQELLVRESFLAPRCIGNPFAFSGLLGRLASPPLGEHCMLFPSYQTFRMT